jgi:hypothetical protein
MNERMNVKVLWADTEKGGLKHLKKNKFQFQLSTANPTLTGVGLKEAFTEIS